ncbi:SLC6A19 (predicted) [Pycnogonum litorale]
MSRKSSTESADDGAVEFSPLNKTGRNEYDADEITIKVPKKEERATWDSKLQFLCSVIGYAVGLGNVWRFPYLCQKNGGGAFLIPYFIMLFAEGIPLFLVELGIGQKLRLGSVGVWNRIHPRLGGLGISSTMVSFLVSLYYNVIITWCLYYLLKSLTSDLPWAHCPEYPVDHNGTIREVPVHECAVSSATSYFWYREALEISPSIEESGGIKWWMTLCLIGAWIICYLCVMRGIQSTGKVVYFTAMFPYVVLVIFFGRAVTLRGAGIGIAHMFIPKMERLADPNVWLEAGTQIFYSLGLGFGGLIAFSSYNDPKNNCKRDAVLVSLCNCMTSIFASFVIFAVIGYKATSMHDKCIESNIMVLLDNFPNLYNESTLTRDNYMDLIASNSTGLTGVSWLQDCNLAEELNNAAEGTGLAFIVFTQVMVELPGGPFWAVIFFLMLMTLGLGSMFGMLEGMATTMFDLKLVSRVRKEFITGIICLVCMIIGLIFMQGSGEYYLQLFDSFCGTLTLMFIAFCEMIAVMYVYGHERFTHDIKTMCGSAPGKYWQYTWRFIAPVILLGVFISSLIYRVFKPLQYKAWNKELVCIDCLCSYISYSFLVTHMSRHCPPFPACNLCN